MEGFLMVDVEGVSLSKEDKLVLSYPQVGGVLLLSKNYESPKQLNELTDSIRTAAQHPIIIAVDHEGGKVWRFNDGFTHLPSASQFGQLYQHDPHRALQFTKNAGQIMAQELMNCGVDISLAPVLDLYQQDNEVILNRAYSDKPEDVIQLAEAFIEGMNVVGMSAVGKHFPGHGHCLTDTHKAIGHDKRAFEEIVKHDLIPFSALKQKLNGIMPGHVVFPKVDTLPASFSKIWLQDILREKLQYEGLIISDCLSMRGASLGGDGVVQINLALEAGCDMVILANQSREKLIWILDNLEPKQLVNDRLVGLKGDFNKHKLVKQKPHLPHFEDLGLAVV